VESCSGSHFLGRALREQGHEVRLMPAQYVKPYVQTNKSDYIDAEAIAEAAQRPRTRFVPIKTEEQLDLQALHRVRERWVMRRTAVVNQIRSLLLECGFTLPKGRRYVDEALPRILEDAELPLSVLSGCCWLNSSWNSSKSQRGLNNWMWSFCTRPKSMKLVSDSLRIPGVGPVTATALIAAVNNGRRDDKPIRTRWQNLPV